jgi:prophage antirepressor-like protein
VGAPTGVTDEPEPLGSDLSADQLLQALSEALRAAMRGWPDEGNRDRWVREHVLPALTRHGLRIVGAGSPSSLAAEHLDEGNRDRWVREHVLPAMRRIAGMTDEPEPLGSDLTADQLLQAIDVHGVTELWLCCAVVSQALEMPVVSVGLSRRGCIEWLYSLARMAGHYRRAYLATVQLELDDLRVRGG